MSLNVSKYIDPILALIVFPNITYYCSIPQILSYVYYFHKGKKQLQCIYYCLFYHFFRSFFHYFYEFSSIFIPLKFFPEFLSNIFYISKSPTTDTLQIFYIFVFNRITIS